MKGTYRRAAALLALALFTATSSGQGESELRKRANAVRATAYEMNFTKIPWVLDVFEGFRLAKNEKRPVFLYMITGNPLDDC